MICPNKKDETVMIGYNDGAFSEPWWPPYYMKNLFLRPEYMIQYLQGFWVGKYHRYHRWKKGYEPNFW